MFARMVAVYLIIISQMLMGAEAVTVTVNTATDNGVEISKIIYKDKNGVHQLLHINSCISKGTKPNDKASIIKASINAWVGQLSDRPVNASSNNQAITVVQNPGFELVSFKLTNNTHEIVNRSSMTGFPGSVHLISMHVGGWLNGETTEGEDAYIRIGVENRNEDVVIYTRDLDKETLLEILQFELIIRGVDAEIFGDYIYFFILHTDTVNWGCNDQGITQSLTITDYNYLIDLAEAGLAQLYELVVDEDELPPIFLPQWKASREQAPNPFRWWFPLI